MIKMLLVVSMLAAIPAGAQADEHSDPFEAMQNPKRLLRGAMLTESQVTAIRELRRAQWAEEKEIQKKLKATWDQFDEKFTSNGPVDQAALTGLLEQGQRLQAQGEAAKLKIMIQVRALLTPAQLARVSQAHQKMKTLEAQERSIEPTVASESGHDLP